MKILITGNLGYVGPNVIKCLKKEYPQAELIGFDTGYFIENNTYKGRAPESLLSAQYYGDVREFPEAIMHGVDAVIHLAAISNDPMSNQFEQVTYDINHKASINLALIAKKHGVKTFAFASSCSVYGFADEGERKEDSELNPLTAYAKSKVFTERDLQPLADENFRVTCLRFSTASGMSDRLRLDLVMNDFIATAIVEKKIKIMSDGTPWRPLINTSDMARALSWAISDKNDSANYLIVNVGHNSWNIQVKDLANLIKKYKPEIEVEVNPNAQPDKRSYKVNFDLFTALAPEAIPVRTFEDTIQELFNGLESIHFNDIDFRKSNLIRLHQINNLKENNLLNHDLRWI